MAKSWASMVNAENPKIQCVKPPSVAGKVISHYIYIYKFIHKKQKKRLFELFGILNTHSFLYSAECGTFCKHTSFFILFV